MAVYVPLTYTPGPLLDISMVSSMNKITAVLPINKNGSVLPELVVLNLDLVQLLLGGLVRDVATRDHGVLSSPSFSSSPPHCTPLPKGQALSSFTISSPLVTCILLPSVKK
jgi:hypothetical protein